MSGEGSHGNLQESHAWGLSNCDSGSSDDKWDMKSHYSSFYSPTETATEVSLVGRKRGTNGFPKDKTTIGGGGGGGGEKERRRKMKDMYSDLHAFLPQIPAKVDASTILEETVKYIITLQHNLQTLEKQKLEMIGNGTIIDHETSSIFTSSQELALESREVFLADHLQGNSEYLSQLLPDPPLACFQTWFLPNVVLSICGNDAQISVCSVKKPRLLPTIFYILEKHKLDVVSAHISSDRHRCMYMIHVRASGARDPSPEALPVGEVFKLVVAEMNECLSSC